jgi:hypothetical protein
LSKAGVIPVEAGDSAKSEGGRAGTRPQSREVNWAGVARRRRERLWAQKESIYFVGMISHILLTKNLCFCQQSQGIPGFQRPVCFDF